MRVYLTAYFYLISLISVIAQNSESPYKIRKIDFGIVVGSAGGAYFGYQHLKSKDRLDASDVFHLSPQDVNSFDRGAANYGFTDHGWGKFNSDYVMYGSFFLPFSLLADKHIRKDAGKVGVLYLETMGIMSVVYTWGVGSINRKRPYVYNQSLSLARRTDEGALNSFFGGHPAAVAAATFFAAKVYNDYHPDNNLKYYLWGAAIIPPVVQGYIRYKQGMHFPTDIIAGIPIGAAIGILVPELHKIKEVKNLSILPIYSPMGKGVYAKYMF